MITINGVKILKTFSDNEYMYFNKGNFDDYCVYITKNGKHKAPKDIDYFSVISYIVNTYEKTNEVSKMIYDDFVDIYNNTGKKIEEGILNNLIDKISLKYGNYSLLMNKCFSILYLGMIAEENKAYTVLGKKIKRLGMHMLLIEKFSPEVSANYSKGKKARDLLELCKTYGF